MSESHRHRMLSAAYLLLSEISGPFDLPFRVLASGNGCRVRFTSKPREFSRPAVALEEMQEAVMNCFEEGDTLSAKTIARKTGYAYSSRLRTVLAEMCRPPLSVLEKTEGGYRVRVT